jgi:hypothetical protein
LTHRIPDEAFEHYVGLGPQRSYAAVAHRFGVSKRGVTKRARREQWQRRLADLEARARAKADDRAVDDLSTVYTRQLRMLRSLQAKTLSAVQALPVTSSAEAARAMLAAMAAERAILEVPGATGSTIIQVVTGVPRPAPQDDTEP